MIVGSTGTGIMYRMGRCSKRKPAIRASVKYVTLTSGVGLTGLPILPMARARYNDFWLRRRGRSAERGINLKIPAYLDAYAVSAVFYLLVGAGSAGVEWGSFYLLLSRFDPMTAALLAFAIATFVNFVLCRYITFNSRRRLWHEVVLVFGVSGIAFLFNFTTFLFLYYAGLSAMAAKIFATGIGFGLNYGLRQFFIFSPISRFHSLSSFVRGDIPT
jgi:putative flippase GtrA